MKLSEIRTPVSALGGVGPAQAKIYASLGIFTVADLLMYYPKDWEDRTKKIYLADYRLHAKVHTIATVTGHSWFGYGRMRTLKIAIDDGTARAELVAFNRPFLEKNLPKGSVISVTGSFTEKYGHLQSTAFEAEQIAPFGSIEEYRNAPVPGSGILSIYPLTAGLTQARIRKAIDRALKEYGRGISDEIPPEVIARRHLMSKRDALHAIHQPETPDQALDARKSLIYEELYHFQNAIALRSLEHKGRLPDILPGENDGTGFTDTDREEFTASLSPRQRQLLERLPFTLTDGQQQCILEINRDIDRAEQTRSHTAADKPPYTMARLVQGDVGSGKTLTAFFACLRIIDWGGQCAFLAPTELLARQHAENAARLLEGTGVRLAFLTGNTSAAGREQLLTALKDGAVDILIGTHALFSRNVHYHNLHLAVIDEQHRFGVLQRNAIIEKGRQPAENGTGSFTVPSLLMLSATPIPRTLALTVFGDLDISVIKTMPRGRLPVKTYLTKAGNEQNVYEFVRKEIETGHQAYFVYPRIEEAEPSADMQPAPDSREKLPFESSRDGTIKSAEEMFLFLSRQVYPRKRCALIHSRIDEPEQITILDDFRMGKIDILVATSVVEVGVDVPNATCMVIEHADRFGLAALHQLRGRVGRGTAQSHCFLIYSTRLSETGKARMKALRETNDGFIIAEQDMKLRGPGEVTGIQQSGYLTLGIADPVRDKELLELARQDAFAQLTPQQS